MYGSPARPSPCCASAGGLFRGNARRGLHHALPQALPQLEHTLERNENVAPGCAQTRAPEKIQSIQTAAHSLRPAVGTPESPPPAPPPACIPRPVPKNILEIAAASRDAPQNIRPARFHRLPPLPAPWPARCALTSHDSYNLFSLKEKILRDTWHFKNSNRARACAQTAPRPQVLGFLTRCGERE